MPKPSLQAAAEGLPNRSPYNPDHEGMLANLTRLAGLAAAMACDNMERVSTPEGDRLQLSVSQGEQLTSLLIVMEDAGRRALEGAR
ncbi:hypothetical protein GCM10011390_50150 [Aureimonas endophytica]|uniref:Uncharacterized protein n=1 Tax=Aureimonas endophytica TaxID=2027858 RepID=A0A917A3G9_9HYPH|nr:hypothetical protein [Aureimonas endophytica]GGE24678.1 hypothetical protein GCM10011390_50150 [Aureimonas endophytica]